MIADCSRLRRWAAIELAVIFLVLDDSSQLDTAAASLTRIGIDRIAGALAGGFGAWRDAGLPIETSGTIAPAELARGLKDCRVLDVRDIGEFEWGHIESAINLYVGDLELRRIDVERMLGRDEDIVATCSVAHRASLAVSMLEYQGPECVSNLLGGMTAWSAAGGQMHCAYQVAKPGATVAHLLDGSWSRERPRNHMKPGLRGK